MRIEILYQTQYSYGEPVSFSPHLYRLFPKPDRFLDVRHVSFQTNADAAVTYRRDLFDNEIASCFYPEHSALLSCNLRIEVNVHERNPFSFLLASHALEFPFKYEPHEARVLQPYLHHEFHHDLPFWKRPESPRATLDALLDLNLALHENIGYERRDEGVARPPADTLAIGTGACRDFALLMAEVLRANGVAARLGSGYLCEFEAKEKRAEGALHAWTEAYLPGAGWVGFDPTNGVLCNHNHLTCAVGLTPDDVSPVVGRYYHSRRVPAQMLASLHIHEIP
jgi:transglutaminase-like putative cysteine protease